MENLRHQGKKLITNRLLQSWVRCRRKAWLDYFGDNSQRLWTAHRTLQLAHQHRSFASLIPTKFGKGLEACKKGDDGVLGIRIKGHTNEGISLEVHPPLLQKVSGKSCWGEFAYRPVVARQGRRITREHRLILAMTGFVLEPLQNSAVPIGLAISKTSKALEIENISLKQELKSQLLEALSKLNKDLSRTYPPQLTSDRRKCSLCSWRGICNEEALKQGDLNEVSGIGSRRRQLLHQLGIESIKDLAKANPINLTKSFEEFEHNQKNIANQLISQAKVQCSRKEERLSNTKSLPELESANGVLLYDIESDPDESDNFLHGFVSIKRDGSGTWRKDKARYQPILTLYEHGEKTAWKRIKLKIENYKNWPILHYGETESLAICQLAKRQGATPEEVKRLKGRLIDIHARLRKNWLLPLNSYGLKTVANWTDFKWSNQAANGAYALLWWRQWKGKGEFSRGKLNNLKWIFQYNNDDCIATWSVAMWLLDHDQISN